MSKLRNEPRKATRDLYRKYDLSSTMQAFYKDYGGYRPTKGSQRTLKDYRFTLLKFFKDEGITDIDAWMSSVRKGERDYSQEFDAYLRNLALKSNVSDSLIHCTIYAFYKFCERLGLPKPILERISVTKKNDPPPYTRQDIITLLNVTRNPRDRAAVTPPK